MSSNHRTDSPPAGNPAPGLAAPPQSQPGCNAPDGGQNPKPEPPIKLTRELLKARAAGAPKIPPGPPPQPDYDGFDDGDGADGDDGYEDNAAFRAEVENELAEAAEAESHLQSKNTAKGAQLQAADKAKSPMYEPIFGSSGFSFADRLRMFQARQDALPRMLAGPRERFLAHLVRRPGVLRLARPHLWPEHFGLTDERTYQIVVRQLYLLHDAGQIPPGGPTFAALQGPLAEMVGSYDSGVKPGSQASRIQAEMQKMADELYGDGGDDEEPGLLRRIFDVPAEALDDGQGFALLRQFLVERQVVEPLSQLFTAVGCRVPKDLGATLDDFRARSRTFASLGAARTSFREEVDGLLDTLSEGWGRKLLGLRTGLDPVDKLLGGLQGLTVLGAPPGTGKTVLVTQLGLGVAEHPGDNDAVVVFLVLDMAKEVVQARVISHVAGIDYEVVTKGSRELRDGPSGPFVTEADAAKLEAGVDRLRAGGADDRLFFLGREDVDAGVSAASLRATLDACKAKAGARRALLIIDYLQLLPGPPPPPPSSSMGVRQVQMKAEDPMEAARRLIEVVQDAIRPPEGTPSWARDAALVVSETRKPPTGANGKSEQTLDDLMGTTRLAYAADAILLLRPMTDPDVERVYKVKKESVKLRRDLLKGHRITPLVLKVEKARDGSFRGDVPLEFEYTRSTMTPVDDPFVGDPAVGPLHPSGPAPSPMTSPEAPTVASAGGPAEDGQAGPTPAPAVSIAPPLAEPGKAGMTSGVATTGTDREQVLAAMAGFPAGETLTAIAKAAKLSNDKAKQALDKLAAEGLVVAVKVTKLVGKGPRTFDGFALASTGAHQGPAATEPG